MSKVLVDRELLGRVLDPETGEEWSKACRELRNVLAQPAEAKGVQPWRERIIAAHPKSEPGYWPDELLVAYMQPEIEELRAALSAVTAERDRLREALGDKALCAAYAERQKLRDLIAECVEYLNTDRETSISSGSVLHRKLTAAMAAKEA